MLSFRGIPLEENRDTLAHQGQDRVAVKHLHGNDKDTGSNPTATRKEKWTLEDPLHRRCPSGPRGSKWKTSDIKAELDLETKWEKNGKRKIEKNV